MIQLATRTRPPTDLRRAWVLWLLLAAWLGLYGPALITGRVFGYRDAAHYYYPLYEHIRDLRAGQWLPLWNSAEDLGRPLAGDPTSAVFYPLALWWALPLPFPRLYVVYIALHALAAAGTMYWSTHGSGHSRARRRVRLWPMRAADTSWLSTPTWCTWSAPRGCLWLCTSAGGP